MLSEGVDDADAAEAGTGMGMVLIIGRE